MNQDKIGSFISELRKEKNLTQKELAERIGVSDKTISKWETGRGIPDIAYMEPLCTSLGITMNELISGEKLSEDAYSAKAEENIMTLMNENATNKKSNIIATLIGAVLLIAAFALMMTAGYGYDMLHSILYYLDLPSFIILAMMSCGCVLISGKRDRTGVLDVLRRVSIPCGVIVFFITIVVIMGNLSSPETLGPTLAVALLSVIYATMEYLVVVLIQARIK